MDEVYTLQEVADKMKVSVQSITKIVKSGKMKSVLVGRQYRITETFLHEYLNGIYGDTPVKQTRAVNPTEKLRKAEPVIDPITQDVATEQTADTELGINMFPDIQQVEPVSLIIKLKADGMTYPKIAEHLNGLGIKTAKGCTWTKATVENNVRSYKKSTNE